MAHKRSDKKTSFGKKSAPHKAFLKKGRKSKDENAGERPKRTFSRSAGSSATAGRSSKWEEERDSRKRRPSDSNERPKRSFGRKTGEDTGRFKSGDNKFSKKRFSDSEDRPKRSFDRPSGSDKRSFSKPDGERPFKRASFDKAEGKRSFSENKREGKSEDFKGKSAKALGFTKKGPSVSKNPPSYEGTSAAPKKEDGLTRLNKHIANSGLGSRREADEMIKKGLISVNGVTITEMGHKVKPGDVVRYEDRVLKAEKPVYVLLNKPKGFITTTSDPKDRKTVMNLVANACKERLYPVGRLDRNTTGLLLLTNDGDLAEKLTHPSYNTKKIYKVELDRPLTKNDFQKIMDGVRLEEGKAIVDDLAITSDDKKTIGIELHIGWNRVVRRIFESLEYEVVKLDRVIFAGLDKKDLPRGEWRFLKPEEVVRLKHFK